MNRGSLTLREHDWSGAVKSMMKRSSAPRTKLAMVTPGAKAKSNESTVVAMTIRSSWSAMILPTQPARKGGEDGSEEVARRGEGINEPKGPPPLE